MLPLCCTIGDTNCTAPKEVKVFNVTPASPNTGITLVLKRKQGQPHPATLASIFAFFTFYIIEDKKVTFNSV